MADTSSHWTLDRRVPIALIVTLLLQFAGGAWWLAQLSERTAQTEADVAALDRRISVSEDRINLAATAAARIEERLANVATAVGEMKDLLRRALDQGAAR